MTQGKALRFRTRIDCCRECVPPKRHIGCHGDCPEYIEERKQLDKETERLYRERMLDNAIRDASMNYKPKKKR